MEVHVVSKADNHKHAIAALDRPQSSPVASSGSTIVCVKPLLIALTSNNLSYARGGDILHWWDTYPVPADLPAPYNDQQSWGIVPAWGFGVVTDTTLNVSIPRGTLLWGFWPTANMCVSLQLAPNEHAHGQWTETSEARKHLMTIYNGYSDEGHVDIGIGNGTDKDSDIDITSLFPPDTLKRLAWAALFKPTWSTGYLLSQYVFTSEPSSRPPIHPLGNLTFPWTVADADLSASVLISLSASSKTGRSFAYHVFRRSEETAQTERALGPGPRGFVQFSSTPEVLEAMAGEMSSGSGSGAAEPLPNKAVGYQQVDEAVSWIDKLQPPPERIVVVDFGARAGALATLVEGLQGTQESVESKKRTMTTVHVGSEQKVYTPTNIKATKEAMTAMGKIQFNASGVRDAAVRQTGAEKFYDNVQRRWEEWMRVSHEIMPDIQVRLGSGISGDDGIEGGWSRLCRGGVTAREGLTYVL